MIIIILVTLSLSVQNCDQILGKKDSDDTTNAAALLLGYVATSTAAANRAAAEVRAATSAAASAVSNAASGGNVTFKKLPLNNQHKMIEIFKEKSRILAYNKKLGINLIPTALSRVGGTGTCNATGCNATLTGSENCDSGSFSTSNLQVSFSFTGDPMNGDLGFTGTMKGDMKMNKCGKSQIDYFNYPSMTSSVTTGNINYDGTQTFKQDNVTMSGSGGSADLTIKETSTTKSTDMVINGGATQSVNVTQNVNLTINSVTSNQSANATASEFTFKASYADTVTGTVSVTGNVSGGNVNVSRSFNKDKFTYDVDCKIDITNGTGNCNVTIK
ncbi:MAG: hypothetical protein ACO1NV_01175 [Leptospira bouyouniensis]